MSAPANAHNSAPDAPADHAWLVRGLRAAASYIHTHRGRTMVIGVPSGALTPGQRRQILHDISVLASVGIRLVVVHGADSQIDAMLDASPACDEPRSATNGVRICPGSAIYWVRAAVTELRTTLEAELGSMLRGSDARVVGGNYVGAQPIGIVAGIDFGFAGTPRTIDTAGIQAQLDLGNLVLLSPLGSSPSGETFHLATDRLASTVAAGLGADKLVLYHDAPGVVDSKGELQRQLTPGELSQIQRSITAPATDPQAAAPLQALLDAARGGVARCHLIDHRLDGALLAELFSPEGLGSQISDQPYESLRPATLEDTAGIIDLIRPLEASGHLVPRSRESLERDIAQFVVADLDGLIIGCAALQPFADTGTGELVCFATHPEYRTRQASTRQQRSTIGEALLQRVEADAAGAGVHELFVLTTKTADWFREHGFDAVDAGRLPAARQATYNPTRNSRVLVKSI